MARRGRLRCSFCGKDETEVKKLVAGARAYICDECVSIASQIMDDPPRDAPPREERPAERRGLFARARRFLRGESARRVDSPGVAG